MCKTFNSFTELESLMFLAECHAEAGDVAEGISRYRQAISAGGNWADIHRNLSALRDKQRQTTHDQPQRDDLTLPMTGPLRRAA